MSRTVFETSMSEFIAVKSFATVYKAAPDMRLVFLSARQRRIKSRQNALAAERRVFYTVSAKEARVTQPRLGYARSTAAHTMP